MNLADITPLILTFNEAPNIGRCLERLRWATRVLVMDSGSTDETLAICATYPNVEVVDRKFDSFAGQCNAGLALITTDWVLSLDADYLVASDFADTVLASASHADGFQLGFRYCIHGRPLRACLYPPRTVLYRRAGACYQDDGHGHKVQTTGSIAALDSVIDHDDRKPLSRWLDAQRRYAVLEAEKLATSQPCGWPDRLRARVWPAAPAAFIYTLFYKRLILDGWPGIFYALQRTYAEVLLSLELLERKVGGGSPDGVDDKN